MTTPVRAAQPPLSFLRLGMTARTTSSAPPLLRLPAALLPAALLLAACGGPAPKAPGLSLIPTSEPTRPDSNSYAVFRFKKNKNQATTLSA